MAFNQCFYHRFIFIQDLTQYKFENFGINSFTYVTRNMSKFASICPEHSKGLLPSHLHVQIGL